MGTTEAGGSDRSGSSSFFVLVLHGGGGQIKKAEAQQASRTRWRAREEDDGRDQRGDWTTDEED